MTDLRPIHRSTLRYPRSEVCRLVSRASDPLTLLTTRIAELGWETILEDQAAAYATYQWQLKVSNRLSADTCARYRQQVERFVEGIGLWPLADGQQHPVTIWHLATPGLGIRILYQWRQELDDSEEVVSSVFGDGYRATERFFRTFLCIPGAIADYGTIARLHQGIARQRESVVLAERYGPFTNPFPKEWKPAPKQRRKQPVPRFHEWLVLLDALWQQQHEWIRTLPPRKWFPLVRTVAMLHLQSATGCRPSELRLVKQGDLCSDRLRILHGGEKDGRRKNKTYDLYGNRRGSFREVSLHHVPHTLVDCLTTWPKMLAESHRVPIRPEGALFPNDFGCAENCVSYERYRAGLKRVLLEASDVPEVRAILGPYLAKAGPDREDWHLTITPHTVRAVYATFRMDHCTKPGGLRHIMQELGWKSPTTVEEYDRPGPLDPQETRDRLFEAFRREKQQ